MIDSISQSNIMPLYLERPRINSLLEQAVKKPVVTVIAGAGYGKTHAVHTFVQDCWTVHQQSCPVVWVDLSERDNDGDWFWENFCSSVRVLDEEGARFMEDIGFPCTDRKFFRFLSMPYKIQKKYLIVFDDVHHIQNKQVLCFAERAISIPYNYISTILISRNEIPINLLSIEAKDLVAKVSQNQLKFSREEQDRYFTMRGINPTEQNSQNIYQSSEGWAFAIRLAGEILVREQEQKKLQDTNGIFKSNIFKLIEKEIISVVSPRLRKFLIKISLLHVQHRELLEIIGDPTLMEELDHIGAFINLDTYSGIYHIHQLLLEYFLGLTSELSEAEKKDIYVKAADWCLSKDQKIDAISYYDKAEDYSAMVNVFCHSFPLVISDTAAQIILKIVKKFPPHVYEKIPLFYVIKTRLLVSVGEFKEAEIENDKAIEKLEKQGNKINKLDRSMTLTGLYNNRGIMRFMCCHITGDYSFNKDVEKACEYKKIHRINPAPPLSVYPIDAFMCRVGIPDKGEMERFLDSLKLFSANLSESLGGMSEGMEDVARAELAFYRMDMPLAEEYCYWGLKKARKQEQYEIENLAFFLLLRIAIYRGNSDLVKTILHKQETMLRQARFYNRKIHYDIINGWFYLKMGRKEKLAQWLKNSFEESDLNSHFTGTENLIKAKYHFISGEYPQALACLDDTTGGFAFKAFLLGRITTYALESVCRFKSGDREKSFLALKTACDLAEPNGLFLPFAELGRDMRNLSAAALEEGEEKTGIKREILERIHISASAYAKRLSLLKKDFPEEDQSKQSNFHIALSPRERKTLAGLYQGLTGEEIARENSLSINTVKSVIKRIYNKLGAFNKADAIRLALEQGLVGTIKETLKQEKQNGSLLLGRTR